MQTEQNVLDAAVSKVRRGELSRARRLLDSHGLAPGTPETLRELRDESLRPTELSEPLPADALNFIPNEPLKLSSSSLLSALKSAGRGSARDLSGMRYEHLRVLMDDDDAWGEFVALGQRMARGEIPETVVSSMALGRLTALKKASGKVRGIVAGSVLRRVVSRALARDFSAHFLSATAPFQFALQTRAGTDAVGQALRLLTDSDPDLVVISLDGIGAFDHVRRSAMLKKLLNTPSLQPLIPYINLWYSQPSHFLWKDEGGEVHDILQGEGGEQGDPLMPALHALAHHDALASASSRLHGRGQRLSFPR